MLHRRYPNRVASMLLAAAAGSTWAGTALPEATTFAQMGVFDTLAGPAAGLGLTTLNLGIQNVGCLGNLALQGGHFCAQTVSKLAPDAFVSAFSISDQFDQGSASVQLNYWYEVVGPELEPGSFIPMEMGGVLGCNSTHSSSGLVGTCRATMALFGEDSNLQHYQKVITGDDSYHEAVVGNFVLPNRIYSVKLTVDVQSVNGSVNFGWVDPQLAIELDDPNYHLVLSNGVANVANYGVIPEIPDPFEPVPEPSTAVLMMLGGLGLALRQAQQRR